ncbi:kinesin-like protein KIN-14J [Malania oleifera]|uniref:kinesin-like protein KIN-14J n=1 Tax=Malania oleifera TaxID=397392 RepID=UPI0025ADE85B|nr:kinesin-like protein KIN-14J [Malania oleifera]XP_057978302.1 kinesin-like protein KIN-14J [Malania oleifera]
MQSMFEDIIMNPQSEMHATENGGFGNSDEACNRVVKQTQIFEGMVEEPSAALRHHFGHKFREVILAKQGCIADLPASKISELMKSNSLDAAPIHSLFSIVNKILDESIEKKNGDIPQRMACLLKKVVQAIDERVSTQFENLKNQNDIYKAHEEKCQSKIRVLETIATGTTEENEVVMNQLQRIKIEKTKIEEKKKLEELGMVRLKKEKENTVAEVSALKQELETTKVAHEEHCLLLEAQAKESEFELRNKLKELEFLLSESRKEVREVKAFSEALSERLKKKVLSYQNLIDFQFGVLKELRVASDSIKQDVLKTQGSYLEELNHLGLKVKGIADAAENYHMILAENRRLYNEVQDLKGNIRVYCRIRPFLPGQSRKHTTLEYVGDNGELVVVNPLKQGKDSHRLFKFNKVFGPVATQEEVFLDTQPLIRSVLDGYNVCIFAYGQTGSGKTYTMSGPDISSKEDWGVNYRALNDLFNISQSRKNSIMYEVGVQMVEIYNEQVRDLLSNGGYQKRLEIWNTTQPNGLAVPDASMHPVKSTGDVLELMSIGLMNRAVGATALNERSSRSHSVLTVHVRGTDLETDAVLRGNLHLVDLAGSERVDRSEATGDRLREAQHINKSLSALGDVIFALAQKSPHVPYRNSKLTQLLQGSLGGQAKTLMFVQLNPDVDSYSETISTLKFAERVSGVELGAARSNKEGRDVRRLMEQVASLKDTIAKKDEEIERLQLLKLNVSGEKRGISSVRHGSSSPRRHSLGASQHTRRISGGKGSGLAKKAASDLDNCSEYSDKQSEAGSQQSVDDFRHQKDFLEQSKVAVKDAGQNFTEDIELLGFGDADSEERLSDISDGGLSMGTETDGSISSIVEYTLFPETSKPAENMEKHSVSAASVPSISSSVPSKLPRPPQKQGQTKTSQLSLTRSLSRIPSSSRKSAIGSSSVKPLKRWQ